MGFLFKLGIFALLIWGAMYAAHRVQWNRQTVAEHAADMVDQHGVEAKLKDVRAYVQRELQTRLDQGMQPGAAEPVPTSKATAAAKPAPAERLTDQDRQSLDRLLAESNR